MKEYLFLQKLASLVANVEIAEKENISFIVL